MIKVLELIKIINIRTRIINNIYKANWYLQRKNSSPLLTQKTTARAF